MRLWSIHPRYLDAPGLVALWREALLARAVLRGKTKGYRHHPQLLRFQRHASPRAAISAYLSAIHDESLRRGYSFDRRKVGPVRRVAPIPTTRGQIAYEWQHLQRKLKSRSPKLFRELRHIRAPKCHPLVRQRAGPVEPWERADG